MLGSYFHIPAGQWIMWAYRLDPLAFVLRRFSPPFYALIFFFRHVHQFFRHFRLAPTRGELEVIVGAKELNADYLLLDEKTARNFAETLSLEPTGLIGTLLLAKASGRIHEVKSYLDLLIENNYRISKHIYWQILSEQGEL
ncbi:MAG: DUF3368 domain-containing protein [Firmicutes bacterium]|nr:DUF3368 domain-containing protein [Bacillota bacterium]